MRYKLEAAKNAFKQAWDGQGGNVEVAYRWSCRWLEAERALRDKMEDRSAALQAHLERMIEIEEVTRRQLRERIATLFEVRASEYYVAEAELWVTQAKERGDTHRTNKRQEKKSGHVEGGDRPRNRAP
jgi:hypothetical protein